MICLHVSRNGERLCRAGVGPFGVLSATLTHAPASPETLARWRAELGEGPWLDELDLDVGGIGEEDVHESWVRDRALAPGDTIAVRIVDADDADEPTERDAFAARPRVIRGAREPDEGDAPDDDAPDHDGSERSATARVCLEVHRNGARLCRAGLGGRGLVALVISWVSHSPENLARLAARHGDGAPTPSGPSLSLLVLGLEHASGRHPVWVDAELGVGDTVQVRLVETDHPDPPAAYRPARTG